MARGYLADKILPIFDKYLTKYMLQQQAPAPCNTPNTPPAPDDEPPQNPVFFNLTYHPLDPPSAVIQILFEKHVMKSTSQNPYDGPLDKMKNGKGIESGINRLIVAYHMPPNLGNRLAPRKFDNRSGLSVSEHFRVRRQPRGRQQQQQQQQQPTLDG